MLRDKPYKHIIWDLDHTLWDFNVNSRACISELLQEFGLLNFPIRNVEHFLDDYIRINNDCWAKYREGLIDKSTLRFIRFQKAFEFHGVDKEESRVLAGKFGEEYILRCPHKTALIPGAIEVLEYLKQKDYNQVILTNGFLESQEIKMVDSGLRPYFTHEFVSEVIGAKKPDPKAYEAVLTELEAGVRDCVMIGDSLASDIKGAVNCGMDSIHFLPLGGLNSPATHTVRKLEEIKDIL